MHNRLFGIWTEEIPEEACVQTHLCIRTPLEQIVNRLLKNLLLDRETQVQRDPESICIKYSLRRGVYQSRIVQGDKPLRGVVLYSYFQDCSFFFPRL